jgi:hypothetical protein
MTMMTLMMLMTRWRPSLMVCHVDPNSAGRAFPLRAQDFPLCGSRQAGEFMNTKSTITSIGITITVSSIIISGDQQDQGKGNQQAKEEKEAGPMLSSISTPRRFSLPFLGKLPTPEGNPSPIAGPSCKAHRQVWGKSIDGEKRAEVYIIFPPRMSAAAAMASRFELPRRVGGVRVEARCARGVVWRMHDPLGLLLEGILRRVIKGD